MSLYLGYSLCCIYRGSISFIYGLEIFYFVSGEETKEIRIWKLADNFQKEKKIEVENIVDVEGVSSNKTAVQWMLWFLKRVTGVTQ